MRVPLGVLLLAQGLQATGLYPPAANQVQPLTPGSSSQATHVIRGRVLHLPQLTPHNTVLVVGPVPDGGPTTVTVSREGVAREGGISHVALEADGSFVTPPLRSGTYILRVVRTPPSESGHVIGMGVVAVGSEDVSGVTIVARPNTAITGRFRMESDNPRAEWPPRIVVNAYLALDGLPLVPDGTVVEESPGGRFVVRNAFGPRVLRCGYQLAPGNPWWPSRVLLNGIDVTNVPTDFSEYGGEIEVVFTQHPARIEGIVTDDQGQAVRAPWVFVSSADRSLWQQWASTSHHAQGDTTGRFSVPVTAGRYLVAAVPQTSFNSWREAREGILRFAPGGVAVELKERERKTVNLTAQ